MGLGLAPGLGLGTGVGMGLGLGDGLWAGTGLSGMLGIAVEGADGFATSVRDLFVVRFVLFRGVAGELNSVGAGPTSAGLETSAPLAAGVACLILRRLADADAGMKEHVPVEPLTGVSVSRLPLLRPLSETMVGVAVVPSPACSATAVYPLVVDATTRPLFPSAVVNSLPLMVSVVSPVIPNSSHLNVPT